MLRRVVAHASREALVERIAAEEVVDLRESALYVSRVRLELIGHEQDVTLCQRVLRAGPGVLVLCERTAKAVGLNLLSNVIGVAEEGCLDLCLQNRVGILRLEVSELAECQRVVPGEEARLLYEAVRDGLEVLLVLLVARRAEELCGEPDAFLEVRALVVRARAALLAFVDAVDGFLRLGEVAPDALCALAHRLAIRLVKRRVDARGDGKAGAAHRSARRAAAEDVAVLHIGVRRLVKARPR